jgi:hypothetical protein
MKGPDNIQRFNDIASQVFALLYEAFPRPAHLGPEHFGITKDLDGTPTWRDEDFQPIARVVDWLADEGFLRMQSNGLLGFHDAVLTQKGLAAMQSVPDAVSGASSLGSQMTKAVKSGTKQIAWKLVEQVIAFGFKQI